MNIGLYFGTFNPIHVGHLVIANYMAEFTDLDQVWFVVSPQNPLKDKNSLLPDFHRLALVREAIYENPKLSASDVEFHLSKPSYTITTMGYLLEKYPQHSFSLIMGKEIQNGRSGNNTFVALPMELAAGIYLIELRYENYLFEQSSFVLRIEVI